MQRRLRQPDPLQQFRHPSAWCPVPLRDKRFRDNVLNPHARVERAHRVLEHHLQLVAEELQSSLRQRRDVGAFDDEPTRRRPVEAGQ